MDFSNSDFDTVIFQKNDQIYTRSSAVFEISKTIGGFCKVLLIFSILPISLTDSVYRYIALRRFKVFGKLKQCDISIFNKTGQFID